MEICSPFARIAVTGSGLVALLNSFRTARVNSFALWHAVRYVVLGSAPSLPTSEAMAARLLEPYAVAWPQPARDFITPKLLVDMFAPSAHGELTSARPALMAYALGCMGSASTGSADAVLWHALRAVYFKLTTESERDALSALASLAHAERLALRDVVTGVYTCAELAATRDRNVMLHFKSWSNKVPAPVRHDKGDRSGALPINSSFNKSVGTRAQPISVSLADLIECLRERSADETDSDVVLLQPPYAALIRSWVRRNGALAVSLHEDKIDLDFATRSNLVLINDEREAVSKMGLWGEATAAFWECLRSNGIGFRDERKTASGELQIVVRVPASAEEFNSVPALAELNAMLSVKYVEAAERKQHESMARADKMEQRQVRLPPKPSMYRLLHDPLTAEGGRNLRVANLKLTWEEQLGLELIMAFRHFHSHIWGEAPALVRNGLTAAVVTEAVDAVVAVLAKEGSGHFAIDPENPRQLTTGQRLSSKRDS